MIDTMYIFLFHISLLAFLTLKFLRFLFLADVFDYG